MLIKNRLPVFEEPYRLSIKNTLIHYGVDRVSGAGGGMSVLALIVVITQRGDRDSGVKEGGWGVKVVRGMGYGQSVKR